MVYDVFRLIDLQYSVQLIVDVLIVQYVTHLITNVLTVQYNPINAHVTINICFVVLLLYVAAFISHLQAGHVQRNRFIINVSKFFTYEFKMQCYHLKWC
jgi:hypothetical protein